MTTSSVPRPTISLPGDPLPSDDVVLGTPAQTRTEAWSKTSEGERPVALITGATRGIGKAIADALAHDHHLLIGGTGPEKAAQAAATYPSAEPWAVDLTNEQAVAVKAAEVGRLDVLVHSAGVAAGSRLDETDLDVWREVFEINVFAVAGLTRHLLPQLRTHQGQVIVLNSGAGYHSGPGNAVYAGSKFAVRALADSLRAEERGAVRVTSIHPGRVDTDMQVALQERAGREYDPTEHLTPASVAATVRTAIDASPEAMIEELSIRPAH